MEYLDFGTGVSQSNDESYFQVRPFFILDLFALQGNLNLRLIDYEQRFYLHTLFFLIVLPLGSRSNGPLVESKSEGFDGLNGNF